MANRVQTAARKVLAGEAVPEKGELRGGNLDLQTEINKQSELIQAGVRDGDIIARINLVTRKVGGENGKKYQKEYLQLVPINFKGMTALSNNVETTWGKDEKGDDFDFQGPCAVKDYFYGYDLGVKSRESQRLAVLVEGPDNAKRAAAKQLAKAFNISEDEAMAKIEAMGA